MRKFKSSLIASIIIGNFILGGSCAFAVTSYSLEAKGKNENAALGKLKTSAIREELAKQLSREDLKKNARIINNEIFKNFDEYVKVVGEPEYVKDGNLVIAKGNLEVDNEKIAKVLSLPSIVKDNPAEVKKETAESQVSAKDSKVAESAENKTDAVSESKQDNNENSAGGSAAVSGKYEALRQAGGTATPEQNENLRKLLSVSSSKIEDIKKLLDEGADPNFTVEAAYGRNKVKYSVPYLYKYLEWNSAKPEVIKLLIDYGAYYNWESDDGMLSMASLFLRKNKEIRDYWLSLKPDLKRLQLLNMWSSNDSDRRLYLLSDWMSMYDKKDEEYHLGIFNRLMDLGLDPNEFNMIQNSYISYLAYQKGGAEYLKAVMNHGGDPGLYKIFELSVLYSLMRDNDPELLSLYISHGGKIENQDCRSALDYYLTVKYQQQYRNNSNGDRATEEDKRKAAYSLDFIKLLVGAGASYNYESESGKSSIAETIVKLPVEIVEYWLSLNPDIKSLKSYDSIKSKMLNDWFYNKAVKQPKHLELTEKLIDLGCDPNGISLVRVVYEKGGIDYVRLFVEKGADLNEKRRDTPIVFDAFETKDRELIKLFIDSKVDINTANKYGESMLYAAVDEDKYDIEMIKYLIDLGADVNFVRKSKGITVLMNAVKDYSTVKEDVVELLLSRGANPNAVDGRNRTALIFAISEPKEPSLRVIEKLLKAGADVNLKDQDGATSLSYAIGRNNIELIKLLQANGGDMALALSVTTKIKEGKGSDAKYVEKSLKDILNETDKPEIQAMKDYLKDYL